MTETQKIKKWFKNNKYLTCMQAIHKIGVYNLRSRASELGLISTMIEVVKDDGKIARVARYEEPKGGLI